MVAMWSDHRNRKKQASTFNSRRAADLFKTLSDATRLQMLHLIAESNDEGMSCSALSEALDITAPTVTHHLKKLSESGLVTRRQHGKWAFYKANTEQYGRIMTLLSHLQ